MASLAIYPLDDGSGAWAVEFCDPADDGVVEVATFDGPRAERQARDYMRREYGDN
jgi:hypothetical protein